MFDQTLVPMLNNCMGLSVILGHSRHLGGNKCTSYRCDKGHQGRDDDDGDDNEEGINVTDGLDGPLLYSSSVQTFHTTRAVAAGEPGTNR